MSQKNIPYEKSFASHPKSKYWHPIKNGKIMPRMCFKSILENAGSNAINVHMTLKKVPTKYHQVHGVHIVIQENGFFVTNI